MSRATATRVGLLVVAAVATLLTAAWVLGPDDGRVVLEITATHGVHSSDVPVVIVWLVVVVTCAWGWRRSGRS